MPLQLCVACENITGRCTGCDSKNATYEGPYSVELLDGTCKKQVRHLPRCLSVQVMAASKRCSGAPACLPCLPACLPARSPYRACIHVEALPPAPPPPSFLQCTNPGCATYAADCSCLTCKAGYNLNCGYGSVWYNEDIYNPWNKDNVCACCDAGDHCLKYIVDTHVPSSSCSCEMCAPGFVADYNHLCTAVSSGVPSATMTTVAPPQVH